jgi:hypothetical protein
MSLDACMNAQGIAAHVRPGLQALGANSHRVTIAAPGRALRSSDLDYALKQQYPNDPRWDYGVEWCRGQERQIAWIEVHRATSGEVECVLAKLQWLRKWLGNAADACNSLPASYHWVATDAGVHIDAARRRRLNAEGLRMPRPRLQL